MTICPFCRSNIAAGATRCPHCTSFINEDDATPEAGQVTYVIDKGLVTFLKFSGSVLAIFAKRGNAIRAADK